MLREIEVQVEIVMEKRQTGIEGDAKIEMQFDYVDNQWNGRRIYQRFKRKKLRLKKEKEKGKER